MSEEHEIDGAEHAKASPDEIPVPFLLHDEKTEGDEDGEGDDLLHDFELRDAEPARASDAVRGNLQEILEERDAPADECGDVPFLVVHVAEMSVPCESHEDVGADEKEDCSDCWIHL